MCTCSVDIRFFCVHTHTHDLPGINDTGELAVRLHVVALGAAFTVQV